MNQERTKPHLHAQIILRRNVNKHGWFLDKYTGMIMIKSCTIRTNLCFSFAVGVHCNYQVTKNDIAWNEYIKKGTDDGVMKKIIQFLILVGGDFAEFGEFRSNKTRGDRYWPRPPKSKPVDSHLSGLDSPQPPAAKRMTIRAQADARRERKRDIAETALKLAEGSVNKAMDHVREKLPEVFLEKCTM